MDWKILIKNFRHKKLQTVLIFLIIMLCSMLLTSSVSILISLGKPFEEFAKECESPSAILFPYNSDGQSLISLGKQFAELPQIARVEHKRFHYISEEFTYNGEKLEGFFKLTEFDQNINSKERYLEGNKDVINKLKANECILPACISNEYNIHTGDVIKIKLPKETLEYTVRAVFTNPYNTSTAFDSDILVKSLPKNVSQQEDIILYAKEGVPGSEIEEDFRLRHNGQLEGQIQTLEERIDKGLIVGNIAGGAFLSIGTIMLFVSCLIISFMIRNAIITDSKTIAIYKTIGYTSSDIIKMYLSFYFSIVTVACFLGIGSSVFISGTILSSIFENMGGVSANNIFLPAAFCYILVASIVTGLIYMIIGKTKKLKPIYALNGMTETSTKKRHRYKGDSKLQFSAFGISMRNLTRNKRGAVSTILTCILTIFSINFAIISLDVAYSMKDNNDFWLGIDKSDVMIEVTDNTQYDKILKTIKEDLRVDYYLEGVLGEKVSMKWKRGMSTTGMKAFIYDDFNAAKLPVVRGRNPDKENEIAISSKIAGELKKDVGDYIEIYLNNKTRVDLLVTGIFQTYFELGDCCRLTTGTYEQNNVNLNYSNISIYLKNNKYITSFINDIKEKIGGSGNVTARTETFASIMNMIVKPQENAIPPVTLLVLIIGAINIFCIVMIKNITSQKNNGIYKCIGYTTGHLILSNMYYVGIIAVVSMAVAIPAIVISYPFIMKSSLAMFGFLEYPVNYNIMHIASANIGVAAIFIISTFISSRSLKNVNVRELVQE